MGVRRCLLTAGSWSQHLQPDRGGSTVGGGSSRYRTVSLFPFLRTCIAAGEPASSSVSSHTLNHLSSWVLAARSKPFNTVLAFRPKNWQVPDKKKHCHLKNKHQLFQISGASGSYAQIFSYTNYTQELSVDTLKVATLHKHWTADMGILESPLTSQPKEGTKGPSQGEWPVG